jgi:uncharacterized protein (DUF433 family)
MGTTAHIPGLGMGFYTLPQAARMSGVAASSIRRWLKGYSYSYRGHDVRQPAVVDAPGLEGFPNIVSFQDLIEVQFVNAFRQEGVSWKTIRIAAEHARELTGATHPFASSRFVSDGRTIFAEIAVRSHNRELLDLRNNQMAFRRVLLPSLRAKLDLGTDGVQRLWPLGKRKPVVIDPQRQFGQPITAEECVPTAALARSYAVLGTYAAVANWYCVSRQAVRAAVEYETALAA